MDYSKELIDELKRYCDKLSLLTECGVDYFHMEGLRLPTGCSPESCDAMFCPKTGQNDYPSRLFLSQQVVGAYDRNWNSSALIGDKNWVAFSWKVPAELSPIEAFKSHLSGFTRKQ